ncbi:MAG: hypothetical protein ACRDQ5_28105 [Sciscionella sp.]
MPAQVVPQVGNTDFRETSGQPSEEPTFLARDAAAVDKHKGTVAGLVWRDQRAYEVQAVVGADGGVSAVHRQSGSRSMSSRA